MGGDDGTHVVDTCLFFFFFFSKVFCESFEIVG